MRPIVRAAGQQPPPLQLFDAQLDVMQHPLECTAVSQSAVSVVESCATWHPYCHAAL
tara:strand:- start:384 stop:554 length:171 start_codon:yes stop_codon:yes gene_type:complete